MTLRSVRRLLRDLFRRLTMEESERRYLEECEHRPLLSDDEFMQRFYPERADHEVPLRIRRIFQVQLGFEKAAPTDNPCEIWKDLGVEDIGLEIAEEFGVAASDEEIAALDGTFDSFVRWIDDALAKRKGE